MDELFLSASVPVAGRGTYHESADPFLIQCAVRELVSAVLPTWRIVWGGHPAITPMLWSICEDINAGYAKSVVLYQSLFFTSMFPEENKYFGNVQFVDAVAGNKDASLERMRLAMLSRSELKAAVFIGGMEGVEIEYQMFTRLHPEAKVVAVPAPGGAARILASRLGSLTEDAVTDIDFARLFHRELVTGRATPAKRAGHG